MEYLLRALAVYLALINLALFVMMGADKSFARRGKRRIPEARLFAFAVLGGGLGGMLGMYAFRHKTQHPRFVVGFPAIVAAQAAAAVFVKLYIFK